LQEYVEVEQNVWNETVANLTLMALGSSAPEILLNVLQVAMDIGKSPPELGPSTIVGSAAFNLLVISGVSIIGVGDEPKYVKQTGVFAITSISSIFAYIWMLIVLKGTSPNEVEIWEAILTFVFAILLIIFAYAADRIGSSFDEARQTEAEKAEKAIEE
jgi:solute carrier family 8 (sodium/calcium exchanger)